MYFTRHSTDKKLGERLDVSNKDPKNPEWTASRTIRKDSETDDDSIVDRIEPVFHLDLEEPAPSLSEQPNPQTSLAEEIQRLQPEIDSFARMDQQQNVSNNQMDVLRKYITLKEQESSDLKEQQRQYQAYVRKLTSEVQSFQRKAHDLASEVELLKARAKSFDQEREESERAHREELVRLKGAYEDQIRRTGNVSAEYKELDRRREEWKAKVREDLKRIKLKERELENKYELLKRDTQALLDSKDKHVMDLKRKNDALELEMESLEERLRAAHLSVAAVQSKKRRLIETLRLALTLLEQMDQVDPIDIDQKKTG